MVKAFNTVFADALAVGGPPAEAVPRRATFVCGDHADAVRLVAELARSIGLEAVPSGALANARHLEAMAHLHIQIATAGGRGTTGGFAYV